MRVVNERITVETVRTDEPGPVHDPGQARPPQAAGAAAPAAGPEAPGPADEPRPTSFEWRGRKHVITRVARRWRETPLKAAPFGARAGGAHGRGGKPGWWIGVGRELFRVETDTGMVCELSLDLRSGTWLLTRVLSPTT